jgi:quinol monooxygenase YgiN
MARFGMVGKLVAQPGRGGELLELLIAATRELQGADGCELYVVSQDRDDLDTIWVFEAWRDEAAHRASLDIASGPRGDRARAAAHRRARGGEPGTGGRRRAGLGS